MLQIPMPICGIRTCTSFPGLSISRTNSTSFPCHSISTNSEEILKGGKKSTESVKLFLKLEEAVNRGKLPPPRNLVFHIQQPFLLKNITSHPRHHPQKALHKWRRSVAVDQGGGAGSLGEKGVQQIVRGGLVGHLVAFTTPLQYAERFEKLLRDEGAEPLWCPTIVTQQSEQTRQELECFVRRAFYLGELKVHGVAFTSRAGIRAFSDVLSGEQLPFNSYNTQEGLEHDEPPFIVAALGKDAELLQELNLVTDSPRISVVVPAISTPQALVESLGKGNGRTILCPVPTVEGLEEPPVVPDFLQKLRRQGWDPIRVNSYVTRWLGRDCAKPLLVKNQLGYIDALVFTSTAEIEGLLKSFESLGLDGVQMLQRTSRKVLVACHGPVTALGAQRLGVKVDVVGKEFQSFAGVIKDLEAAFRDLPSNVTFSGEARG